MTKLKLCGLTRLEDVRAANACRPDYVGFVFAPSRRQVTPEAAATLRRALEPGVQAVGVFVRQPPGRMADVVRACGLDLVQLHGGETAADIQAARQACGVPVIAAVRVRSQTDLAAARSLPCDYLLLDAYTPDQYGGAGQAFDWTMLPEDLPPYFLAGGIRLDNLDAALSHHPYAVDVSSGVETGGVKDPRKMAAIAARVRRQST